METYVPFFVLKQSGCDAQWRNVERLTSLEWSYHFRIQQKCGIWSASQTAHRFESVLMSLVVFVFLNL